MGGGDGGRMKGERGERIEEMRTWQNEKRKEVAKDWTGKGEEKKARGRREYVGRKKERKGRNGMRRGGGRLGERRSNGEVDKTGMKIRRKELSKHANR